MRKGDVLAKKSITLLQLVWHISNNPLELRSLWQVYNAQFPKHFGRQGLVNNGIIYFKLSVQSFSGWRLLSFTALESFRPPTCTKLWSLEIHQTLPALDLVVRSKEDAQHRLTRHHVNIHRKVGVRSKGYSDIVRWSISILCQLNRFFFSIFYKGWKLNIKGDEIGIIKRKFTRMIMMGRSLLWFNRIFAIVFYIYKLTHDL